MNADSILVIHTELFHQDMCHKTKGILTEANGVLVHFDLASHRTVWVVQEISTEILSYVQDSENIRHKPLCSQESGNQNSEQLEMIINWLSIDFFKEFI